MGCAYLWVYTVLYPHSPSFKFHDQSLQNLMPVHLHTPAVSFQMPRVKSQDCYGLIHTDQWADSASPEPTFKSGCVYVLHRLDRHDLDCHPGNVFMWVTHPWQCQGWSSVHVLCMECNLVSNLDTFWPFEAADQGSTKYTKNGYVHGWLPY